jgi:hypothetical protein
LPVGFVKLPVKSIKKFYVNEDREEWKVLSLTSRKRGLLRL